MSDHIQRFVCGNLTVEHGTLRGKFTRENVFEEGTEKMEIIDGGFPTNCGWTNGSLITLCSAPVCEATHI